MAEWSTNEIATYGFTVLNGKKQPTDLIDGTPTTLDGDPAIATSAVVKGDGVGKWNLNVTGLTPSPVVDGVATLSRTTVTVDADMLPGPGNENLKVGFVEYSVKLDPIDGAMSIEFGEPTIATKPTP